MQLAGLTPVGAIAEIVAEDRSMMRLPGLLELGERDGVPVITIEQLILYIEEQRCEGDPQAVVEIPEWQRVSFEVETNVPTAHGDFPVLAYKDRATGTDHLAVVTGRWSMARSCGCTRSASPARRSARSSASAARSWMPRSTGCRTRAAS